MLSPLTYLLKHLPDSYLKSMILNLGGFVHAYLPLPVEEFTVDRVKIKLFKDLSFPNSIVIEEMKGYNQKYQLKKGDMVADVGAYTGDFTIYAAKKVGEKGRVYAFEPDPYTLVKLRRNLRLNNINNVVIIEKGLYSKEAVLRFETQTISSRIVGFLSSSKTRTFNTIPVTTLDSEMIRLGISKLDFVKMDIEGAELEAIRGCVGAVKAKTHFAIASYHEVDGAQTHIALEKFFKKYGRAAHTDFPKHVTTYA